MRRAVLITGVVLIAAAYLAGVWPERRRVRELEAEVKVLDQRVMAAESRGRLGETLGRLLVLQDAVEARNFGAAADLASRYFDSLAEIARDEGTASKASVESLLQARDSVTAALARSEPAILDVLVKHERDLRLALGYPVSQ
jgi:hypothetical protein